MRGLPQAVVALLAMHALCFGDVLFAGRSLSPATYTTGLTPAGPHGAPPRRGAPHLLDVEGAAWVDEPSPYVAGAAWHRGLPLWNPGEGLGAPLAANLNSGAANPLQMPLNLAPGPGAADAFYLARVLVLALGTWAYLGALGVAPMAALLGAVIAGYGGYTMAWIAHHPLSVEIFLPCMLLGLEHGRRGRPVGFVLLALAVAGALLGGKLQAALLCLAFVVAMALLRGTRREGGSGASTLRATVAGIALGIALAGYLLVPAAELVARASGLTLGGRSALAAFTLPWPALASVAAPGVFVPPERIWPEGGPFPPGIGVTATLLAAIGATATRSPLQRLALACVGWAAALLLRNAGVFGGEIFTHVPIARGIFFLKYTFTAAFALAVAAAIGVDALVHGLVPPSRALRIGAAVALVVGVLLAASALGGAPPVFAARLALPVAVIVAVLALVLRWRAGRIGSGATAALLVAATVLELRMLAPRVHPPRLAPYRPPPYVEFLRGAPAGRMIAADDLATPLTSAAAGLRDVRAIDVLTPGSSYAFFTRLLSFCPRVIHFTVDPDLVLAATAPALDLAGVRYVVAHGALELQDLDARVARQVGHERVARLLSGMRALRSEGTPLGIGPAAADDPRFAFTLTTPSALEVEAESEAPELAWSAGVDAPGALLEWSADVVAERTSAAAAAGGAAGQGAATADASRAGALAVAPTAGGMEVRVPLGAPGVRRRVRLRIAVRRPAAGTPVHVALANLGFSPGAAAEATLLDGRRARHRQEAAELRPIFSDAALGVMVYENGNALPRAFRVSRSEPVRGIEDALDRLGAGFDFRTAALVTSAATAGPPAPAASIRVAPSVLAPSTPGPSPPAVAADGVRLDGASGPPLAGEPARAEPSKEPARAEPPPEPAAIGATTTTIVRDDPMVVTIATDGPEHALVVLTDLSYPGWEATIDGTPAPMLEVDGLFRGVEVPPGPHSIEEHYRPRSWLWGGLLSIAGMLVLAPYARVAARAQRKIAAPFERVL